MHAGSTLLLLLLRGAIAGAIAGAIPGADLVAVLVAALKRDTSLRAALTGGIWDADGAGGQSPPYANVFEVADVPEWEMAGEDAASTGRAEVQLSLWAGRRSTARALARRAIAVLEAADLSTDDGEPFSVQHTGLFVQLDDSRGKAAEDVFHAIVTLAVLIDRTD